MGWVRCKIRKGKRKPNTFTERRDIGEAKTLRPKLTKANKT